MAKILVVDDNLAIASALELLFDLNGLSAVVARSPDEALDLFRREDVAVVVQDMNFQREATSGREGVDLMRAIRSLDPDVPIVLMTAFTSLEMAVQLVKEGANDYVAKPWDDDKLLTTVRNLLELRRLATENAVLLAARARQREQLSAEFDLRGLIYGSPPMHDAVSLATRVALSDVPVLVTGPNGCGKEKLAEIVQANSRRRSARFVKVNAGGLPDALLEAELFGAEAGAYTGASRTRIGRFEEASGGTIFLDEIGNLSMSGQAKLLRVLQTGEFQRLGGGTRRADVRVISATNADLPRAIAAGTFREDLYFRLNVIEIRIAPLRDRPEDVLLLAEHFLRAATEPVTSRRLGPAAQDALLAYPWPGNVRELENRVRRAILVARGEAITPADLGLDESLRSAATASTPAASDGPEVDAERAELERALREAGGVVSRAAARLGVSRQAFYRRLERAGLALERRVKG